MKNILLLKHGVISTIIMERVSYIVTKNVREECGKSGIIVDIKLNLISNIEDQISF